MRNAVVDASSNNEKDGKEKEGEGQPLSSRELVDCEDEVSAAGY